MALDLIPEVKDIKYKGFHPFKKKKVIKELNEAIKKANQKATSVFYEKQPENFLFSSDGMFHTKHTEKFISELDKNFGLDYYTKKYSVQFDQVDLGTLTNMFSQSFLNDIANLVRITINNNNDTLNEKQKNIQKINNNTKEFDNKLSKEVEKLTNNIIEEIKKSDNYKKYQQRKYEKLKIKLGEIIKKIESLYSELESKDIQFKVQKYEKCLNQNDKPDAYSFYDAINAAYKIVCGNESIKITKSQQNLIYWLLENIYSRRSIAQSALPTTNPNPISDKTTKYTMISLMNAEVEDFTKWEQFSAQMLAEPIKI